MEYPTLPQRLLDAVDRYASARAQIHKVGGEWKSISAQEMLRRVAGLSRRLEKLGIRAGDRVAVFAPNSPEWHTADLAILGLGAVSVPVYFRESPERMAYILDHAGAVALFVSGEEQVARAAENLGQTPGVRSVIAANAGRSVSLSDSGFSGALVSYDDVIAEANDADVAAYREGVKKIASNQLASIIYTSGTTGEPKGVMLSHANFTSNVKDSFERFGLKPGQTALSFLPLSHVFERVVDYGYLFRGVSVAYVPRLEDVSKALLEVHPDVAAAVPRFYEKMYATILEGGAKVTGVRHKLFNWAMKVARRSVPWKAYGRPASVVVRAQWAVANRLVFEKFREGTGGHIAMFISGGAPLAPELAEFFTAVGMPVYQGYGLTEASPVIATNLPEANHVGTVGLPIPECEARLAPDGELQVRGPMVMMGYYRRPDETATVVAADGWLSTGDIAQFDPGGYLMITDRKKELLKTAGGKLVAPAPIENAIKSSPYVMSVAVIGDRQRFIGAVIAPNFATLQARASKEGRAIGSPQECLSDPWVYQVIESEIQRVTANLAQYERVRRFALVEREFTYDGGELTSTLKLKRRVINERYADAIARLYEERPAAR